MGLFQKASQILKVVGYIERGGKVMYLARGAIFNKPFTCIFLEIIHFFVGVKYSKSQLQA